MDNIIKACKEAEALGWRTIDYNTNRESDADTLEKDLRMMPHIKYTRRRTNFEITWSKEGNAQPVYNEYDNQQVNNVNPVEQMLRMLGYI